MRILLTTGNSSLLDGINRHILEVATALSRCENVDVSVVSTLPPGELHEQLIRRGITAYSLCARNGHDFRIFLRFYRILCKVRPDIIHVHVMPVFAQMVAKILFRDCRYVCTIHGLSRSRLKPTRLQRFVQNFLSLIEPKWGSYIFISKGVCKEMNPAVGNVNNYSIIYNPISFDVATEKCFRLHDLIGVGHDVQIVGTACRFADVKRPELFVEVLCKVLESKRDVHAVLMGDGQSVVKDRMRAIAKAYSSSVRLHWLGFRADAPDLVGDLSCFVMTSSSEGLPTSMLEAFARRTPVAFMRGRGGLMDMGELADANDPLAIVANDGDVDGLANGVEKLLSDTELAKLITDNAYKVAQRHFSIEHVQNQIMDLYKSLEKSSEVK